MAGGGRMISEYPCREQSQTKKRGLPAATRARYARTQCILLRRSHILISRRTRAAHTRADLLSALVQAGVPITLAWVCPRIVNLDFIQGQDSAGTGQSNEYIAAHPVAREAVSKW
jgi:hypothetical protein